jgi:hypothetical protein
MSLFTVKATGADLREISLKLRRMNDAAIKKKFRKELRYAAAPFVPAVRGAIMGIPVKGEQTTGLRKRLSKAVTLVVRVSGKNARVSVLPAYMEGVKSPWRHPVFGEWVEGQPDQDSHPYFFPTVRGMSKAGKAAVNRVVSQITGEIT